MMKNKSTIARLLAEEDIHVVNKKMDTAYFNIKKRELGLPIWKDEISKVEEELMVCHEIGHALWTSMDMIEKAEARGLNSSFVNILEDARIEKFVKRKYPGSVNLFKKGYAALGARDFFGIANEGVNSCNLIDRINLFFKGAFIKAQENISSLHLMTRNCIHINDLTGRFCRYGHLKFRLADPARTNNAGNLLVTHSDG